MERYRLAHGTLPESLDEIVPDFLPAIPEDYYAGPGSRIRYRAREDGEFVVYSVGRDMEDDHGVEMEDARWQGDITFIVAPLSVRMGPHIREE